MFYFGLACLFVWAGKVQTEKKTVKLSLAVLVSFSPKIFSLSGEGWVTSLPGNTNVQKCITNVVPRSISLIPLWQFLVVKGRAHDLIPSTCLLTFLSQLK